MSDYLLFKRVEGDPPPTTLRGTGWKLSGMVDVQTGVLTELEPKDCVNCYSLMFHGDSIILSVSIWVLQTLDLSNLKFNSDPARPYHPWTDRDGVSERPPLFAEEWREWVIEDDKMFEVVHGSFADSWLYRWGIAYTESYELSSDELKLFFDYQEKSYYLLFKLVYQ
jgi:hypothetical protein